MKLKTKKHNHETLKKKTTAQQAKHKNKPENTLTGETNINDIHHTQTTHIKKNKNKQINETNNGKQQ